jgi:hypothetical protein
MSTWDAPSTVYDFRKNDEVTVKGEDYDVSDRGIGG